MPTKHREAGFTLIEMAIVLVIIGLILGAILKGQDLIENSRAKRFANFIRQAEIAQFAFLDRHGYYAGDNAAYSGTTPSVDGVLNWTSNTNTNAYGDLSQIKEFKETLQIGSSVFRVGFGSLNLGTSAAPRLTPYILVQKETATELFSEVDSAIYCMSFDTIIDGLQDPSKGKVIAVAGALGHDVGSYNGMANTYQATGPTPYTKWDNTVGVLIYLFDSGSF